MLSTRLLKIRSIAAAFAAVMAAQTQTPPVRPDVIWVPTQDEVVTAMLKLANVGRNDVSRAS